MDPILKNYQQSFELENAQGIGELVVRRYLTLQLKRFRMGSTIAEHSLNGFSKYFDRSTIRDFAEKRAWDSRAVGRPWGAISPRN